MKKSALLLTISLISLTFTGCFTSIDGEGPIQPRPRKINNFSALTLEIPADLTLIISDTTGCIISAQSNINEVIQLEDNGEEIIINSSDNYKTDKPVSIIMTTPSLEKLKVRGSGNIIVLNTVKGPGLSVSVNGSGNIELTARVEDLKTKISGSGNMTLKGEVLNHEADISGSGNLHAFELSVSDQEVKISGSGNAEVFATEKLDARVSGSGNIFYKGEPNVSSKISGSGEISKAR